MQSHERDEVCPGCLACAILEGLLKFAAQLESNELIPVTRYEGEIRDGKLIILNEKSSIIPARQLILPPTYLEN